jgi:hypothetical protein
MSEKARVKIPFGVIALLTDRKFWSALATLAASWTAVLASDVPPEHRAGLIQTAIWATAGIVGALIAAMGFEQGKALEGTVPEGYESAAKAAATVVQAGTANVIPAAPSARVIAQGEAFLQGDPRDDPNAQGTYIPGKVESTSAPIAPGVQLPPVQPRPNLPDTSFGSMIFIGLLAFVSGGCVGTSEPFRLCVVGNVRLVASELQTYNESRVWDLNGDGEVSTGEIQAQRDEREMVANLAASVTDRKTVTLARVKEAWEPAAPVYASYVAADPTLPTPEDKAIPLKTAQQVTDCIAAEQKRQAAALNPFARERFAR